MHLAMWNPNYKHCGLKQWLLGADSKWVKQDGFESIAYVFIIYLPPC